MTPTREFAASLTARVIDRIEGDRMINSENIADVIADGLLLREARGEPQPTVSPEEAIIVAAKELAFTALNEPALYAQTPPRIADCIEKVYRALRNAGWKP